MNEAFKKWVEKTKGLNPDVYAEELKEYSEDAHFWTHALFREVMQQSASIGGSDLISYQNLGRGFERVFRKFELDKEPR